MPSRDELVAYARQAAERAGFDSDVFVRQITVESNFDPKAGSPAGAQGIAQIVPKYHPGVDPWDPYASLDYAARWMADLTAQYGGDVRKALVHYNGGGGAVQQYENLTPYAESARYVTAILDAGKPDLTLAQFGPEAAALIPEASWVASACGPIALSGLAASLGDSLDLDAAIVGASLERFANGTPVWTPENGMAGPGAFALLAEMARVRVASIQRDQVRGYLAQGRCVVISTPKHYYLAQRLSRTDDDLFVGHTGEARLNGGPWMSLERIEELDGEINALFVGENAVDTSEPAQPATPQIDPVDDALNGAYAYLDQAETALKEARERVRRIKVALGKEAA
jgi:hypothetical protein